MTSLMHDETMWTQSEAMRDVLAPRLTFSTGVTSGTKRRDDVLACAHCGRVVTALIFNDACTYECALTLATAACYRYDYVYTAIMSQVGRGDVSMPRPAPRLYYDTITPERFWERATEDLYSHHPAMAEFLRERLAKNAAAGVVSDKKRRAH